MSPTTDQFLAALATALGVGLLRLWDALLPKDHHLKVVDRYMIHNEEDEDEDEAE